MVAVVTGNGLGLSASSLAVLGGNGQLGGAGVGRGQDQAYVNAKTGSLVVQVQDELLVGRGPDIGVSRTYNSNAAFDFDNNDGWQLSLYRKLASLTGTVNTAGSSIVRYGADGSQTTYSYDASLGKYLNKDGSGSFDSLSYTATGSTWTWTDGDSRVSETYSANGSEWRISQVADLDGNALTYTYDANGLISQIADANGETTKLIYDAATKRLQSLQVVTGSVTTTRIRYTYDASGRLSSVSTDLTPADGVIADGKTYTTTYTYDGTSTRIASITNSDGTKVSFTYDASFRVQTMTDGAGKVSTFTYNAGSTSIADPLGQVSTLTFDGAGNLTRLQGPTGSGQDVSYTYDTSGNLTQLKDSRGNTIAYSYDASGNLLRQQDSAGNVLVQTFNTSNQLLSRTVYALPDPDGAGTQAASLPQTTYYVYDAKQHLRFTVSAEGRVSEFRYNTYGQQTTELRFTGASFTVGSAAPTETDLTTWVTAQDKTRLQRLDYAYDARGLLSSASRYAASDSTGAGLNGAVTQYVYDAAGHLVQQIDPRGVATTGVANDYLTAYAYDGLGRTLSVTQYDAAGSALGSGSTRQTVTVYNDVANRIELSLANGLKRVSSFDLRGLLVSQAELDGSTSLSSQSYQYDADGRLRITTDANGNKSYLFYDAADRQVGLIDAAGSLSESIYNAAGQLIKSVRYATPITAATLAAQFTVDAGGTVTNALLANVRPGSSSDDVTSRALYDAAGRLRFAIDGRGAVQETRYDGAGRVLARIAYANLLSNAAGLDTLGREALPSDLLLLSAAPTAGQIGLQLDAANDRVTRNFYDAEGCLRASLDGEGSLTEFKYDAAGRLVQTLRYATPLTSAQISTALGADPAQRASGALVSLVTAANATPSAALQSFVWYNGLGQTIASLDAEGYYTAYQYDAAGNQTQTRRYANRLVGTALTTTLPTVVSTAPATTPSGGYVLSQTQDQIRATTWTAFNQVDTETAVDGTLSQYSYDSLGNRVKTVTAAGKADSRTLTARYDKQGRLVQELSPIGAVALAALGATPTTAQIETVWTTYGSSYGYDAGGRRIKSTDANGNITLYFYDADNRLTYSVRRVKNPANAAEWQGEVSQRQYNALGQVTAEVRYANRITASYFAALSGGSETQVKAAGVIVADAANDSRTDTRYNLTGQVATSTVKLNASQNAVTSQTYNAFGEVMGRQTSLDSRTRLEQFSYDRRGLALTDSQDGVWASNSAATAVQLSQTYDVFGRVASRTDGNGNVTTFGYDKLGRQVTTTAASGSLNLSHSTSFDAFGRVLTQTDALGYVTSYSYAIDSTTGRTTLTVTSPEAVVTQAVSDRYGQTLTMVDGLGNEIRSTYDANGNLLTTRRWDKLANVETLLSGNTYDTAGLLRIKTQDANGTLVSFTYDAASRVLTRTVDPGGLNLVTAYTYDAKGQQVTVTDPLGSVTQTSYDLAGRVILVALDPSGLNLRTQYSYDLAGNRLTLVEGYGTTEARTSQYSYDSLGRRTQTVVDPSGLKLTTTYAYDKNSNLVTQVEAAGTSLARITRFAYDQANRQIYSVDALGGVVKNDYDAEGRLIQSRAYANAISLTGLATNPTVAAVTALVTANSLDRVSRYAYDKDGRQVFSRVAQDGSSDHVTEKVYNAAGKVVKVTAYATALAATTANSVSAIRLALASSSSDRSVRTVYDAQGQVRFTLDALGFVKENRFDAGGNLVKTIAYAKAVSLTGLPTEAAVAAALVSDAADQVSQFNFDKAGRLTSSVDALGKSERFTYDGAGNKKSRTDKNGYTWTYDYDRAGRQTDEHSPLVAVTRVTLVNGAPTTTTTNESITSHLTYDALGNVKTRTEAYGAAEARTTSYGYDVLGHQVSITYPPVGVYDASLDSSSNGLADNSSVSRSEAQKTLTSTTVYDALGNATVNCDVGGKYAYKVYDTLGRIRYEIDAERYLVAYSYDVFGNQTGLVRYATALNLTSHTTAGAAFTLAEVQALIVTSADDRTLSNTYDVLNQLLQTSQAAVYNYDSGTGQYFSASPTTKNSYNAFGQIVRQSTLKNLGTDNTQGTADDQWLDTYFYYDAQGQRTAQVDAMGYLTTCQYDANGNLVQSIEYAQALTAGSWTTASYGTPTATTAASATAVSAIGFDRITQYAYDGLNHKTAQIQKSVQYSQATTGAAATSALGDLTTRYAYDANGNLVATTDTTGATTYSYYDALGRTTALAQPVRVSETGGTIAMPAITVATKYLDIGPVVTAVASPAVNTGYWSTPATAASTVDLAWNDLAVWGTGAAQVIVSYAGNTGAGSKTVALSSAEATHGTTVTFPANIAWDGSLAAVTSITRVQLQKMINGTWVTVIDSTADTATDTMLVWEAPAVQGAQVKLQYRPQGSGAAWSTATIANLGERCWADVSGLASDQYEYILSYTRAGETTPYAQGSGVFAIERGVSTSSRNVVADVLTPYLDIGPVNTAVTSPAVNTGYWSTPATAASTVDLAWNDLGVWGSGAAQVIVSYAGNTGTGSKTVALSAAEAAHGTTITFPAGIAWDGSLAAVTSITRVQLQKMINGVWVTLQDSATDVAKPRQLVLRGNTTALTGVNIYDANNALVGTYTLANAGLKTVTTGIYSVDVSGLAPGNYTYTPIGTASAVGGSFNVRNLGNTSKVQIGEQSAFLDIGPINTAVTSPAVNTGYWSTPATAASTVDLAWNDLGVWGAGAAQVIVSYAGGTGSGSKTVALSVAEAAHGTTVTFPANIAWDGSLAAVTSITRVQLQKVINGAWVTVADSTADSQATRLELSSLPATAATVQVEYRKQGDTGPYLVKPAAVVTKLGAGWFSFSYDDIANGDYEYRLTVKDAAGVAVNLTSIGGNTAGQVTGVMNIRRGGQSMPTTAAQLVSLNPVVNQTYDRWGNVLSISDAANAAIVTNYRYNWANQVVEQVQPTTDIWTATGTDLRADTNSANDRPTSRYAYDAAGRLLASTDANGNINGIKYDAAGQQVGEYHADGGVTKVIFDAFGRKIASVDANGNQTSFAYDRNDRQTLVRSALGEESTYTYDQAGHQKSMTVDADRSTNHAHYTTAYYYDRLGNQVRTKLPLGQETRATFDLQHHKISESHLSNAGVTVDSASWSYSYFGRLSAHTDMGGATYGYSYDYTGALTQQTDSRGQNLNYAYYENGLLKSIKDYATAGETFYQYDAAGRRTRERYRVTSGGTTTTAQDTRTAYDELGRIAAVKDNRYAMSYAYDAVGNRRHTVSNYYDTNNAAKTADYWYTYDGVNRILISQGVLVNGTIQIDVAGTPVLLAGGGTTISGGTVSKTAATGWGNSDAYSRDSVTGSAYVSAKAGQTNLYGMFGLNSDPTTNQDYTSLDYAWYTAADGNLYIYESGVSIGGFGPYTTSDVLAIKYDGANVYYLQNGVVKRTVATSANRTFSFDSSFYNTGFTLNDIRFAAIPANGTSLTYDAAGNRRAATSYQNSAQVTESYTYDLDNRLITTSKGGNQTSIRDYDATGHLVQYTNFSSPGVMSDRRVTAYNANGWTTTQLSYNAANTLISRIRYDYADAYDSLGNVTHYTVEGLTGTTYTYTYTKAYQKFEGYKEQNVHGTMSVNYPYGTTTSTGDTTSSFDANGNLIQVLDRLGTNTTRNFVVNSQGLILTKTQGSNIEYYFYANGTPIGSTGGTAADFDYNYTPVSDSYPSSSPTSYVVNAGDTLQGIALAVFGDAKLWYLIADANGLSSDLSAYVGKTITIPNRISNIHNDYATYKPYNGGAIVGDTTPTVPTPEPPPPPQSSGGGCGVAQIIVAIVVVVATIYTAGALTVAAGSSFGATMAAGASAMTSSVWVAAAASAIGNIAGQITGMALGIQNGFNWRSVASSALTGAAMAGMGNVAGSMGIANPIGASMVNAAASNVVGQGINIITGQQKSFNWASVAASAIAAPISASLNEKLFGTMDKYGLRTGDFAKANPQMAMFGESAVNAMVSAGTRSAIEGGDVQWASVAADALGGYIRSRAYAEPVLARKAAELAASERIQRTEDFGSSLKKLNETLGGTGTYETSAKMAEALAGTEASRELAGKVETSNRYGLAGRVGALIGASDAPNELGLTIALPEGEKYAGLRKMWDSNTFSLKNGFTWADFSAEAVRLGVGMAVQENGITNSPSQAFSNSASVVKEMTALGQDTIVVSAYNPTHGQTADGIECLLVKSGVNTASVEAARILMERAVAHNATLADQQQNDNLRFTQVWGHSEGSLIVTQAALDGMDKSVLSKIDMKVFGTATGAAPEGLHSFVSVRNANDFVATGPGQLLSATGGVEHSSGYFAGNASNPDSYRSVETHFLVSDKGTPVKSEWNHSWQYYMTDSTTRSSLGLAPLNADLTKYYGRSYWLRGE